MKRNNYCACDFEFYCPFYRKQISKRYNSLEQNDGRVMRCRHLDIVGTKEKRKEKDKPFQVSKIQR